MGWVRVAIALAALALIGSFVLRPEQLIKIELVDQADEPWARSLVETTLQCISTQTEETTWHPLHKSLEQVQLPVEQQRCKVTSPTVVSAEFTLAASPSQKRIQVRLYAREKRLRLQVRNLPESERMLTSISCYDISNEFSYTFSRLDAQNTQEMSVTDGPLRCVLSIRDLDYAEQTVHPTKNVSDLIFDFPKFNSSLNIETRRADGSAFLVPAQHTAEIMCWGTRSKSDSTRQAVVARARIESGEFTTSTPSISGWTTCSAYLIPKQQSPSFFAGDMHKGTTPIQTSHIFVPFQDEVGRIHDDLPNEISFIAIQKPAALKVKLPEPPKGTSSEDNIQLVCSSHNEKAPYRFSTTVGDLNKAKFGISPKDVQGMHCSATLNGHQSPNILAKDSLLTLVFPKKAERLELTLDGVTVFDNILQMNCTHAQYESGSFTQELRSTNGTTVISAIPGDYTCSISEGDKIRTNEFKLSLGEERLKRTVNLLQQSSCKTDLSFTNATSGETIPSIKGYLKVLSQNHSSKEWFDVMPPLRFRAGTASFEVPQGFEIKLSLFELAKRFRNYALPSAVTYKCLGATKEVKIGVFTKPEELRTQVKFKKSRDLTVTEIKKKDDRLAPHAPLPLPDVDVGDTVYQLIPGRTYLAKAVSDSPEYISREYTVEVLPGKSIKRLSIWLPEARKTVTIRTLIPGDRAWSRRVRSLSANCSVTGEDGYFLPQQHIVALPSPKRSLEQHFRIKLNEDPPLTWNIACHGIGEMKKSNSSIQRNWNSDEFSFVKFSAATTLKSGSLPPNIDLLLFPTDEVIPLEDVPQALLE